MDSCIGAFEVTSANEGLAKREAAIAGRNESVSKHVIACDLQFTHEGFKKELVLEDSAAERYSCYAGRCGCLPDNFTKTVHKRTVKTLADFTGIGDALSRDRTNGEWMLASSGRRYRTMEAAVGAIESRSLVEKVRATDPVAAVRLEQAATAFDRNQVPKTKGVNRSELIAGFVRDALRRKAG